MTLVSIITPSFNQAAFLEETLRSVLEQDYPDIEYIVVDGGSTDGSVEIIQKYAHRLAWWVSEPDSGQAEAINKGFARASGDIVAWLNSDDLYLPQTIAAVVREFEQNPKLGLLYGNVLSIDAEGTPIYLQKFRPYALEDLMAFQIISQPGVFLRRGVLKKSGLLDPSYRYLLDHHLWIRVALHAPMRYLPQTLAAARYHANAKNIAQAAEFGKEAYRILAWMQQSPALAARFDKNKKRIHAGASCLDAYYLVEAGRTKEGLAAYLRAFRHSPKTALKSWRRILYAAASLLGAAKIRQIYLRVQKRLLRRKAEEEKRS